MRMRTVASVALCLWSVFSVGSASAVVIGFEDLVSESTSYTEDGFSIATTGALRTNVGTPRGNPPPEMYAAQTNQTNTLTRVDGGSFDLVSIELAGGPEIGGVWPQMVTFTGMLAGGGSVMQSFSVAGTADAVPNNWQLFNFSSEFVALASVSWTPEYTLADNVVVQPSNPLVVDPDASTDRTDISGFFAGVTLSAEGGASSDDLVYAYAQPSPTGSLSFGWFDGSFFDFHWGRSNSPALRADFNGFLADAVSIDYETDRGDVSIEGLGAGGGSLGFSAASPGTGTLTFTATQEQIAAVRVVIQAVGGADFGTLDHMVVQIPEPGRVMGVFAALAALGMLVAWRGRMRNSALADRPS